MAWAEKLEITKRVLAAIPEGKRDYRPDPHARTAWELAWHLANTDVQFLDAIADLMFLQCLLQFRRINPIPLPNW